MNAIGRLLPYRINVLMTKVAIRFDLRQFERHGAFPSLLKNRLSDQEPGFCSFRLLSLSGSGSVELSAPERDGRFQLTIQTPD